MTGRIIFNGPVGQVAAGDIRNDMGDLSDLSRNEVAALKQHLTERLADARKKILINPVVCWMLLGGVVALTMMLTGQAFEHSWRFFFAMLVGVIGPYFFFIPIQKKYGPLVFAYRANIQQIEIFQHRHGWI
ncbi:hypothetical protein [Pseudomonas sp. 18175]|uniref:hypothetical protein n=1 Tax=Pseudomonas sp. 18175 TaxID=3390056 RepID=UPI003D247433